MKIVLDISTLGRPHKNPNLRTGIFRSLEGLLLALSQTSQEIVLTAGSDDDSRLCKPFDKFMNYEYARDYWRAHADIAGLDFPCSSAIARWEKIDKHVLETNYKARKLLYLASLVWLEKSFAPSQPSEADIYHQPFYPLPNDNLGVVPRCRVVTVHDLIPIKFPQYFRPHGGAVKNFQCTMDSLRKDDFIICPSESTKEDFCQYAGHDSERVHVVPWAADTSVFFVQSDEVALKFIRTKYGIPEGSRYILSLSRQDPRKNVPAVIRSFGKLIASRDFSDLYLVMAGPPGPIYDETGRTLGEWGCDRSRVIFTGFVPEQDLAPLYSGAVFFVSPSFYEGFGLPVLEAMQCGLPVITSNVSSLPEVVGTSGLLVDPRNDDELYESMRQLLVDDRLRTALSKSSIERAKRFTWKRCADGHLEVYRQALARCR